MATYTSTITPRLRMMRTSQGIHDRSGQTASTSEPGPSRLPDFSQLIDVNLNDMAMSDTSDRPTHSRASTPSTVIPSETTPAERLRALLHVLPSESTKTIRAASPSQHYLSERDSDYDITEPANSTKSIAQESLKTIFSNARRDPNTPKKSKSRRNSADTSDVDPTPKFVKDRTTNKGKQKGLSDDDMDQPSQAPQTSRTAIRHKAPVTKEFLRERFSDSAVFTEDGGLPDSSTRRSGNQTFLPDFDTSMPSAPMATSTPQQSLRMSVNSQFQSNLLESDTEMHHAIKNLDEIEDTTHHRSVSPPSTIRKYSRQQSDSAYGLHRAPSQSKMRSRYIEDEQSEVDEVEMSLKSDLDDKSHNEYEQDRYDYADEEEEVEEVENSLKTDHEWDKSRSRGEWERYDGQVDDQEEIDEVEVSLKTDIEWDKSRNRHERSYGHNDTHQHRSSTLSSMELTVPLEEPVALAHNIRIGFLGDIDTNADPHQNDTYIESNERSDFSYSRQHSGPSSRTKSHARSVTMSIDEPWIESQQEQGHNQKSSHSWNHSKSDRQSPLTPRPLLPAHFGGLNELEEVPQSKDENYNVHRRSSPLHLRSVKKTTAQSTQPLARSSSLQTIDNIYMNDDTDFRPPSKSTSPPSVSNKRTTSPNSSPAHQNQKLLSATLASSNNQANPYVSMDITDAHSKFKSSPSRNNPFHDSGDNFKPAQLSEQIRQSTPSQRKAEPSKAHNGHKQDLETDDLRETDFSSRGGTPDLSEGHRDNSEFMSLSNAKLTPSRFSTPSAAPRINIPATKNKSAEPLSSPSSPPRRPNSRNSRRDFETPSPPKTLPDLPTPSSSDESGHSAPRNFSSTSRIAKTSQDSTWTRTPRPPGAWAQTPKPSRVLISDSEPDGHSSKPFTSNEPSQRGGDSGSLYPQTPMNRTDRVVSSIPDTVGKTPKPPGGWLFTPAPVASVSAATRLAENFSADQQIGLLTPTTSLSKGASFDARTPGLPGGWLATPAIRKSILKVRFDEHNEVDKSSSQNNGFETNIKSEYDLPLSLSSPRKSRGPNIRVVDAFGREQNIASSHVEEDQSKGIEQPNKSHAEGDEATYSSRGALLKHIRRGLDELAEDLDDQVNDRVEFDADRARIEELNNLSNQARKAREHLRSQTNSKPNLPQISTLGSAPWRNSRRFWCSMILINLIFVVFMFRLSNHWAKERYLNSYYDPFNPELYLSVSKPAHSLYLLDDDLSRTSWASHARKMLFGERNSWYNWMRFTRQIQLYLWNMWTNDSTEPPTPRNGSTWLPS